MLCKNVERTATISWSPHHPYKSFLASGTVEGIIDEDFQSFSKLEILDSRNPQDCHPSKMHVVASVNTPTSFGNLAWCPSVGRFSETGLIAGAMNDGSILLWDPSHLLALGSAPSSHEAPLVTFPDVGFVPSSVEFSADALLAACSASSDVIAVFDFAASGQTPSLSRRRPLSSKTTSGVESLRWNRKVPHILATGNSKGCSCIWDLRQDKVVITLKASNSKGDGPAVTALSWNPSQALQLAVAYSSQVGEIWDLRNAIAPQALLAGGHSKDLVGVDWNPHDPKVILTSAKDNKCCLWSNHGDLLTSFDVKEGPLLDLRWSPEMPSYFAGSSRSHISIRSVQYMGDQHAPAWLNRTAGSHFGFGNRLLTFFNSEQAAPELSLKTLGSKNVIGERARHFEQILSSKAYASHCREMAEKSDSLQEKMTWGVIKLLFEKDRRNNIISLLGFAKTKTAESGRAPESPAYAMRIASEGSGPSDKKADVGAPPTDDKLPLISERPPRSKGELEAANGVDALAFFDAIAAEPDPSRDSVLMDESASCAEELNENGFQEGNEKREIETRGEAGDRIGKGEERTRGVDGVGGDGFAGARDELGEQNDSAQDDFALVQNSLIVGDFEVAVEQCISKGSYADAFVISSCVPELWEKTQARYLKDHRQRFMRNVLSLVITNKIEELVSRSNLAEWKQTLAIVLTYASEEDWKRLCDKLGERLEAAGMHESVLCYLCSLNIQKIVSKLLTDVDGDFEALQDAVEKIFLCAVASSSKKNAVENLIADYIKILFTSGENELASNFLSHFFKNIDEIQNFELRNLAVMLKYSEETSNNEIKQSPNPKKTPPQKSAQNTQKQAFTPKTPLSQNIPTDLARKVPNAINLASAPYPSSVLRQHDVSLPPARENANVPSLHTENLQPPAVHNQAPPKHSTPVSALGAAMGEESFFPKPQAKLAPAKSSMPARLVHPQPSESPAFVEKHFGDVASKDVAREPASFRRASPVLSSSTAVLGGKAESELLDSRSQGTLLPRGEPPSPFIKSGGAVKSGSYTPTFMPPAESHLAAASPATPKTIQTEQPSLSSQFENPAQEMSLRLQPNLSAGMQQNSPQIPSQSHTGTPSNRPALNFVKGSESGGEKASAATKSVVSKESFSEMGGAEGGAAMSYEGVKPSHAAALQTLIGILRVIDEKNLAGIEKRKVKETFEKIEMLKQKMAKGAISQNTFENLEALVRELADGKLSEAKKRHVEMMTEDWEDNKDWLVGVNTLILLAKRHYT